MTEAEARRIRLWIRGVGTMTVWGSPNMTFRETLRSVIWKKYLVHQTSDRLQNSAVDCSR